MGMTIQNTQKMHNMHKMHNMLQSGMAIGNSEPEISHSNDLRILNKRLDNLERIVDIIADDVKQLIKIVETTPLDPLAGL